MPKFAKGKPRHPNAGRRKGTPNKGTTRAKRLISEGDDKKIVDAIVAAAKLGDIEARRVYFRHLRPPPPHSERYVEPIDYTAPKAVEEARGVILDLGERLAKGTISLEIHDALISGLKVFLADKAADQQRKLDELQEALRAGEDGP
jgi:hypothetical protein